MIKNLTIIGLLTINAVFAWSLFQAYKPSTAHSSEPANDLGSPGAPQEQTLPRQPAQSSEEAAAPSGLASLDGSRDYQELVQQLRAEGVDERLLRQILLATINRNHLLDNVSTNNTPYWQASNRDPGEKLSQQLSWEADRREQLLDLFGNEIVDDEAFADIFKPLNSTLSFLSSAKQIALHELQRRDEAATQNLFSAGYTQESREDLRLQRQNLQRQISELLGTDDAFEYQLRESTLADRMRRGLDNFDYSEQEFRQIFAIRQEQEGVEFSRFTSRDQYREQRQQSEARIRDYLGTERYEAYARSQDPAYRSLQSIGERYGNSTAEINDVYRVARRAQEEIDEIRTETSLDRDERRERISQIRTESYVEIARVAGQDTADSVRENARRIGINRRISPDG